MVPLNETELYTEDRIGLKALDMVFDKAHYFYHKKSFFSPSCIYSENKSCEKNTQ